MKHQSKGQHRRPSRSAEQWAEIVEDWHRSGLPAKEYAKLHGLGAASLHNWSSYLGKKRRSVGSRNGGAAHDKSLPRFVPVETGEKRGGQTEQSHIRGPIELESRCGQIVRLRGSISPRDLKAVLHALEEMG